MTTEEIKTEFATKLFDLLEKIKKAAEEQLSYSIRVNIPSGMYKPEETAEKCILQGISSGVAGFYDFDCDDSLRVAASILEESNMHPEAAILFKMIDE